MVSLQFMHRTASAVFMKYPRSLQAGITRAHSSSMAQSGVGVWGPTGSWETEIVLIEHSPPLSQCSGRIDDTAPTDAMPLMAAPRPAVVFGF